MIKIGVYDHPESARRVFRAFYEMIVDDIPFPAKDIACALNRMYKKEYGEELGLPNSRKDVFGFKTTETYIQLLKDYKLKNAGIDSWCEEDLINTHYKLAESIINNVLEELHDFIYMNALGDSIEINIDNLGRLLCGYMDYKESGKISTDDSYFIYLLREKYRSKRDEAKGNTKKENELKAIQKQLLTYVFCYEKIASKQEKVYPFVESLGVTVCPYCNRNYTQVIKVKPKKKEGFHTRPDLDHFWSKSLYPFLSLSMRNLVPSCKVCNLAKHDTERYILYPYKDEVDEAYTFSIQIKKDISLLTRTEIDPNDYLLELVKNEISMGDSDTEKRIIESMETFGWKETYKANKEYALKVFQNSYIFNIDHINSYFRSMKSIFSSFEECRQILNPLWVSKERFLEQPLSKLTYDVSQQAEEDEKTKIIVQNAELSNEEIIKWIIENKHNHLFIH